MTARPPRRLPVLLVAVCMYAWLSPASFAAAPPPRKVILFSWDAGADWVVDRLLDEGRLTNLARMAREGVRAEFMTAAFPSKTAVAHAAIFTGCWGDVNGITSNLVPLLPRSEHTLLESRSGFSSDALTAEPIFVTAAKAGKQVVALSATQLSPPGPLLRALDAAGVARERLVAFNGFDATIAAPAVHNETELTPEQRGWRNVPRHVGKAKEIAFAIGDVPFFALVYDDPGDPVRGLDTVLVRSGSRDADQVHTSTLKPSPASGHADRWGGPFDVTLRDAFGLAYFRLFDLRPDGSAMTLYQRSVHSLTSSVSHAETVAYLRAAGGFTDDAFGVYEHGDLGPTLWEGGAGEAERRVLEIVRLDFAFATRGTVWALSHWSPDLLLHYTPQTDSAGHAWAGAVDPQSPAFDPALAARIWPFYAQVFELADGWLGSVREAAGTDHVVAVVSDHGMAGVGKRFFPNAVLAAAGLQGSGTGDAALASARVLAPPGGDFFLAVNGTDWKGGVVQPSEREEVLRSATRAMLAARDPETGDAIVTAVLRAADMPGSGMGGPAGGDLYLDLAPGYYPSPRLATAVTERMRSKIGQGEHGFLPWRRSMQAICYLAGPGVARARTVGAVRQIDVFPTLAHLLGITTPATVQGHVIGDALEDIDP